MLSLRAISVLYSLESGQRLVEVEHVPVAPPDMERDILGIEGFHLGAPCLVQELLCQPYRCRWLRLMASKVMCLCGLSSASSSILARTYPTTALVEVSCATKESCGHDSLWYMYYFIW